MVVEVTGPRPGSERWRRWGPFAAVGSPPIVAW